MDSASNQRFFLARSVFHGPNSQGRLEIRPIGSVSLVGLPETATFAALNLGNFSTEFSQLDVLSAMATEPVQIPILPCLLARTSHCIGRSLVDHIQSSDVERLAGAPPGFVLNEDQLQVLQRCLTWILPSPSSSQVDLSPIQLGPSSFRWCRLGWWSHLLRSCSAWSLWQRKIYIDRCNYHCSLRFARSNRCHSEHSDPVRPPQRPVSHC